VRFDLLYNRIEIFSWLNTLFTTLIPAAVIDPRLAVINRLPSLDR
jgi:hypothetical protein